MGKSTQPLLKRCKALGINPLVMGYCKVSKRNQKEVRRKKSEYATQLDEKQKELLGTVVNWYLPSAVADAKLFDEIGFFDKAKEPNDDTDWNFRLKFYNVDMSHCIMEELYLRRVHRSNITNDISNALRIFSMADMQKMAIDAYRKVRKARNNLNK